MSVTRPLWPRAGLWYVPAKQWADPHSLKLSVHTSAPTPPSSALLHHAYLLLHDAFSHINRLFSFLPSPELFHYLPLPKLSLPKTLTLPPSFHLSRSPLLLLFFPQLVLFTCVLLFSLYLSIHTITSPTLCLIFGSLTISLYLHISLSPSLGSHSKSEKRQRAFFLNKKGQRTYGGVCSCMLQRGVAVHASSLLAFQRRMRAGRAMKTRRGEVASSASTGSTHLNTV